MLQFSAMEQESARDHNIFPRIYPLLPADRQGCALRTGAWHRHAGHGTLHLDLRRQQFHPANLAASDIAVCGHAVSIARHAFFSDAYQPQDLDAWANAVCCGCNMHIYGVHPAIHRYGMHDECLSGKCVEQDGGDSRIFRRGGQDRTPGLCQNAGDEQAI